MTKEEKKIIKKACLVLLNKVKELPALIWRDRKYVLTKLVIIIIAGIAIVDFLHGSEELLVREVKTAQCMVAVAALLLPVTKIYEKDFDVHRRERKEDEE